MKKILFPVLLAFILSLFLGSCNQPEQKKRILTLGIRNESNTFSTLPTKESDFVVLRGADVFKDRQWAEVGNEKGVEFIPTLHAYAWPGGVVEREAFEKFKNEILDSIRHAGHLDGIYMDMHGALHVDGYDDAQYTLIKEIREIVGDDVLIGGSFDLHGNLSPEFVSHINLLTAYRTAPHRDGEETKARAMKMLIESIEKNLKPHIECASIPILVPGEKSITEVEPLKSIYEQIPVVSEKEGLMDASIFAGYCWADLPRSAMRVFVVARDKSFAESAKKEAIGLATQIWDARHKMELDVPSGSINEMLQEAKKYSGKTVFISDSGDNTTAGAPGDNTQVLEALLKNKTQNVLFAGMVDNSILQACRTAGVGNVVDVMIAGKEDYVFSQPLKLKAKVDFLSPDSIIDTNKGAAVVTVEGTTLVIMKNRRSFTTKQDFKDVNLDPLKYDMVIVKLGYLYPELRDIAPVHLMALTPGFCNLDVKTLPYEKVARPNYPLDPDMEADPKFGIK